ANPDLGILKMDVFPNPFTANIVLQIEATTAQQIQLEITGVTGQQITQQSVPITPGKQFIPLAVEKNISVGVYILTVKNDLQVIGYFKIVKQ
ncbi:MAG: T9SS type A sorting domain-containing protein, partial [Bacteroidota bacterium]